MLVNCSLCHAHLLTEADLYCVLNSAKHGERIICQNCLLDAIFYEDKHDILPKTLKSRANILKGAEHHQSEAWKDYVEWTFKGIEDDDLP